MNIEFTKLLLTLYNYSYNKFMLTHKNEVNLLLK